MKVWIVNPFDNLPFEGMRPQRYWLMARAFVRGGHETTYWTADFSHAFKRPRKLTVKVDDGFELCLVHEPAYPKNICLRRICAHRRLARNWLAEANRKGTVPDLVIVSSPPLSLAAAARKFCRRTGAKLIVDVQDAWPETFCRVAPAWLLAPLKATARRNYLAADAITAVSRRYLDLVRSYGATCPTHLCYHGIEAGRAGSPHAAAESPSAFRLAYIGNMSLSYDLATVIDAVKSLDGIELDLAGAGPDESSLKARAAECPRIRFHGYLAEDRLRELLAGADAGIVPMFPESCVGIPGKLADYAAAGLPIVNSLPSETEELLAEHGAGETYKAGSTESLASVLAEWRQAKAVSSPQWENLRQSAASLITVFDATRLYDAYRDFAESLVSNS